MYGCTHNVACRIIDFHQKRDGPVTRKREGDAMEARQLSVAVRESPVKVDFSTDGVPEPDRLERWREMSKAVHNIDWYPLAQGIIQQEAAVYRLPGLRVIEGKRTSTGFTE